MPVIMISPAVLVAGVAAVVAAVLVVVAVTGRAPQAHRQVLGNLRRGFDQPPTEGAVAAVGETSSGPARLVRRLTPGGWLALIDTLLSRAGRPPDWPLDRVLGAKLVAGGVVGVLALLMAIARPVPLLIVVVGLATVVAWFLPELLLHSRGQERRERIARELPDTMDQMVIAVEAGLGFEAAMARTAGNSNGPLATELRRTIQDLQMGAPRRLAYETLAERANVPDVRRFVRAIAQGEQYGISIADVLRAQAAEQRLKRRQRAEEQAMKIPVKVLFPLMVCILPVLFIVLLGPAVISMMGTFG